MDNPELMEQVELDFDSLVYKAHQAGLSFPQIFWCILHQLGNMIIKCPAETWLKDFK